MEDFKFATPISIHENKNSFWGC